MKTCSAVVVGSLVSHSKVIHVLQFLQVILLLSVGFLVGGVKAFVTLQPIDLPSIEFYTVDMLRQAALPSDLDNTLSIGNLKNCYFISI